MPGRGNNSLEFQVSLGLQGAQQQIDLLHKALEESVKIDSNGFKGINKMLESAQSQAEKLSSKMGEAFKTSAGSRNFLKDYQKMLETLSQIRSKMGNLGFDDIKFSVQDQNEINDTVKKMQDLEKIMQSIQSGKAINVINNSSVENVDILKKKISDLSIDTSKLTFDNLKVRLSDAAEEASNKLEKTKERINSIDSIIKRLDISGLQEIQNKINTSTGLSTKLIDDKSIDEANRKLRELTEQFNGLSDKAKSNLQVNQKTGDIGNFIQKQTENIKSEYQKQIEVVRTSKEAINKAMQSINAVGHRGKNGRTYYSTQKLTELVNSEAMKTQIEALGINLTELFKDKTIAQQVSALKEALTKGLESLTIKENDLTNLRNSFEQALQNVFTGLTTSSVTNVKAFKDNITETLSNFDIKAIDLKNFGFDINSISAGDSLASVYDRLRSAIDQYTASLSAEKANLSSTELVQRTQALKDLEAAQKAADETQGQSDEMLKTLQEQIAECTQKIEELVQKYNQLTGQKINLNLGDIPKQTDQATTGINRYIESITKLEGKQKALSNVQSAVTRWMGFYQVLNLTKRAINDMKQHIQELDAVMTKIAVVTNMTQSDLWNQIGTYSEIARQYGVAIKGVYEVSQIYYQQGLNKGDVMGLTTETLKMARIAGIDYATAADYMTTAVRGFKLEMSDAAHVTDVFSNLAAHTASSTEELAVAISKTAASAASVGSSFEATSAMMATMIATTRESATNIGTALKSIIARYGELKENMTGTDAEGEEYSLNKVDKALQSVGISIHDTAGQFRDFDDVILELAEAWDTIDKNTQRYIATVMAGNRQQSRFLALVSNVEEYKRALDLANNSDSAGELQVLKTLDSVDAKIERMKVTVQEFYTSSGIEDMYKGILDTITNVISAANDMPKAFGNIPVTAMAVGMSVISTIKNVLSLIIASISQSIEMIKANNSSALQGLITKFHDTGIKAGQAMTEGVEEGSKNLGNSLSKNLSGIIARYAGALASVGGSALIINGMNQYGSSMKEDDDRTAGRKMLGGYGLNVLGGALSGAASGAAMGAAAGPHGALIGAALGGISSLITNVGSLISGIDMLNVSLARQIELSKKRLEAAKTEETKAKASEKELNNAYTKLIDLQANQFDSIESAKEYADYMNQLADIYPSLVKTISTSGDVIIDAEKMEQALADARLNTANATLSAVKAEQNKTELQLKNYQDLSSNIGELQKDTLYNENDIYKLLFNKQAAGNRNRATSIMEQYNLWASASGKETANINPQGYQTYEDAARTWMKSHVIELNSFMEAALTASDMSTDVGNYQKEVLTSAKNSLANRFIALLTEAQSAAEAAGESLNFSTLLGEEIDSLDDIKSWNYTKIKVALDKTQNSIQGYIGSTNETLASVNNAIVRAEIGQAVQTSLYKLRDTGELGKKQASILQNYEGLINSMLGGRYNYHVDWTTDTNSNIIKGLEDWIYQHQSEATELNNLDYNQYRSTGELETKLKSLLVDMDPVAVDEYITKSFQPVFQAARAAVTAGLDKQLKQNNLDSSVIADLIDGEIGTNGELINPLISSLRNGIAEYSKLAKNGLSSVANNYLVSLKKIYTSIGQLESDEQLEIVNLISTLDFSDKDALLSAAENLRELGYEDIASSLEDAAQRLVINIGGGLQALQAGTSEVAKKLEKAADNFSKGIKYSEALETTASFDTNLSFDKLYQYDEAMSGWVLTQDGINEQIKSIIKDNKNKAEELKKNAELRTHVLTSLISDGGYVDTNFSKSEFGIVAQVGGEELDREYANFEQLVKDFEESGETNFEEYLQKQLERNNEYLKQINEISDNLSTNVLSDTLTKINYTDISQGKDLNFNKSLIESILKIVGAGEEVLEQFDTEIWPQMLAGHFESYNTLLSSLGFKASVSSTTEQNAQKANIEQYTNGIKELLAASSNAILSKETQALLQESNIDISSISRKDAASQLIENAKALLDKGEMSLEAYNSIIETANNVAADNLSKALGGGRTKAVLDMAKDGLIIDELKNFANTYHESLSDFINEDTHEITNSVLASIMKYDKDTGTFKFDEDATAEQILNALAQAFNITIENYTDAASQTIASQIAERAKNNAGKQIANQIQTLSSAKVGDEIDISLLTPEMKAALTGYTTSNILTIESEERRDALLLLLETSISEYDGAGKEALIATYNNIKNSITSKKGSQNNLVSGIVSSTVSKDTWKSYVANVVYPEIDINYFNEEDLQTIAFNRGYIWDEYTQQYRATTRALETINKDIENAIDSKAAPETIAELRRQAGELERTLTHDNKRDALTNLITNYQDAESYLSDFYGQFGYSKDFLKERGILTEVNGKSIVDINKLNELVDGYDDVFKTITDQIADEYISNVQKAGTLFTQGTTSQVEMSGFKAAYKQLTGAEVEFIFDPLLQAWTIDIVNLRTYLSDISKTLDLDEEGQSAWVENQIKTLITDNLDFSDYLAGTNTAKDNKVLRKNLTDYFKSQSERYDFSESLEDWAKSQVDDTLEILSFGGQRAINRLKSIKGELTQNEIEAAYRAQIAPIQSIVERLNELRAGNIVAKNQIDALNTAGFKVNTDGVIISTGNLVAAYKSLYDQMKATNEATIAELNTALGKYLDSRDGEQTVIDALSNATSMTYSQLAEIYTQAGIELTESMVNELEASGIIKGLGGNKMMIQDFESFAASMGWNADSEEYVKAFKAYNDSLIQLDNATEKAILEEVNAVLNANPGDKVNLTYLANQLHLAAGEIWELEGATLKDGILSIEKGANIGNITNQLIALARSSTENIEEELEELAYAVQQLLADIANTIKNGISGSLKRDEAKKVTDWASQYGVKVDFNETAEGLQITNNSARDLYNTINAIDKLQGQVVFEALKDNLIKTDERFQSASANAAYIAKLERDIEITKKNNNDKFDDTKINQYKKELELAQKINETRGLTEDSSFKFMEQDIPSGQKNPLNYWSNWGKAFTVMNESRTNGTMAYEDFRNVITEMGNLVDITEGAIQLGGQTLHNSKEAASLIEAAAGALEVQTDGSLKVNLKKIGVEFQTGSESMTDGIDKGIQEIAKSQIEMLDSLIGLLEVIVQMEQLGDIDLDKSGTLEIGELFELDAEGNIASFKEKFDNLRQGIIDVIKDPKAENYNADLDSGLSSIKIAINGQVKSLKEIIQMEIQDIKDTFGSDGSIYTAIMQGIYMSVQSGDFSETNIKELIMQNLQKALQNYDGEITFDMGNYTFIGSGNATFEIDWTNENTQNALEQFKGTVEEKEAQLIESYKAMGKGTAKATQLTAALIANGTLKITPGEKTKIVAVDADGKEHTYDVPTNSNEPIQEGYMAALASSMLEKMGAKNVQMTNIEAGIASGTMTFGSMNVTVEAQNGKITYTSGDLTADSLQELVNKIVDKQYNEWESHNWQASEEEKAEKRIQLQYEAEVQAGIASFDLNSQSYQTINAEVRKKLEDALASGNRAEIDIAINGNPELASLKGLSSQEIEEKLGIKQIPIKIEGDVQEADKKLTTVQEKLTQLINDKDQTISIEMHATNYGTTVSALNTINDQLREIAANRNQQINITTVKTTIENESKKPGNKKSPPKNNAQYTEDYSQATGNVALSKGTLMGELGPELVVSKGRYYIVGQNGPEFVDLEEDAIVFNHLQTKSLLQRGITFGRGAPVTNERNAVAFAGGNIAGPAMASASSILSVLKELRAMWKSLLKSSTKDLASLGGSGGGGGGGSSSDKNNAAKAAEFTKELEMWYNWLQKIASLGEKLTYEEKKRAKIASDMYAHGHDYAESQLKSLDYLKSQIVVEKSLVNSQQAYFDKRRKELNDTKNPFSALYTFDEDGQLKYANGALTAFSKLLSTNEYGKPTYTAEDQYNVLVSAGFGEYMKYNSSGEEITKELEDDGTEKEDQGTFYTNSVQAFWDKVDADKEEMQSLHDSIEEHKQAILEAQTEANEIMREIEDNQISIEDKVLKAIEDIREREIEELQNTRDAMEEAANELISGLSDQLSKEKDMYQRQEDQDELTRLQRQLAILQRSGGSASQIANLQKEITQRQQDAYFDAQQRQIDALQQASDAELARLDNQIQLMTETLAYEKQFGLLWEQVYEVLQGSPEEITDFITRNTREYWGESPTKLTQDTRSILNEAQSFAYFRDHVPGGIDELVADFAEDKLDRLAAEETARMEQAISDANNNMTTAAKSIVDAINAIDVQPQVNVTYTPPESSGSGDTGSGVNTGATSGPAEQKTDTNSDSQKSWIITQAEKIIDAENDFANSIDHWIAEGETEQGTTIKIGSTYKTQAAAQAAINRAQQQGLIISGYVNPIPKAKTGAIVDKSGIAEIHDNEVILTAEQTKFLRNDILSNKPTSLLSLLTDFRDAYNGIPNASAYSTVNNGGVTIENATVEMNVSKISNDYDAQRAGEQALEKMMQIARKTSAQNRIGR